jgi:hypothetical protein
LQVSSPAFVGVIGTDFKNKGMGETSAPERIKITVKEMP